MPIQRLVLVLFAACAALLAGCAGLPQREAVQVALAGLEPLPGQGLEVRMLVKLRVQNPDETPLAYSGLALQIDVQGRRFATGVSSVGGTIPRFGEAVLEVPVSVSLLSIARQAAGVIGNESGGRLAYAMSGRLAGTGRGVRFSSSGEFTLPAGIGPPP